jgi:hypothetical protein
MVWVAVVVVAWALWWPAFPFVESHGNVVLFLSGTITGILAMATLTVALVLPTRWSSNPAYG